MLRKAGIQHITKYLNSDSKVLLRADFNVPIKQNQIKDPTRITSTLPTINKLLEYNIKSLVILSHLGRPQGKKNLKYSMRPVAQYLATALNRKVHFLQDCIGQDIVNRVNSSQGQIFLCQNVRFYQEQDASVKKATPQQLQKIKKFRAQLSRLGQIYVNDAFGTAHRNHSSVAGITHKIRAAGLLMEKQIKFLAGFLEQPKRPMVVVLGGAKVVDKLQLINNMIDVADQIIIGGGMVHPFLKEIFSFKLGSTHVQMPTNKQLLSRVLNKARLKDGRIHFPLDTVGGKQKQAGTPTKVFSLIQGIQEGWKSFDCGPKSKKLFGQVINRANSIFWNGPLGVFQIPEFKVGSEYLLRKIAERTKAGATSIVGGGDSVNLVNSLGLQDQISFISTGGGASVELMQGNQMPGILNLSNVNELP